MTKELYVFPTDVYGIEWPKLHAEELDTTFREIHRAGEPG